MTALTPERYEQALEATVSRASAVLRAFWRQIEGYDPLTKRRALEAYWPSLVERFGDVSVSLAADRFEELVGLEPMIPPAYNREYLNGRMRWGIDPVFSKTPNDVAALTRLDGLLDEFIFTAGRETTRVSAERHNRRVARVPNAGACAWCIILGSRGFDFASKQTAASPGHNDCRCRLAVEEDDLRGYDPDELAKKYEAAVKEAGSGRPSDILAAMRSQGGVSDAHKH